MGKHGDNEEILMRTKHERFYMWAKSALVQCKCGTKFELNESAPNVVCRECDEGFHLSDYRGPGAAGPGYRLVPAGTGDEGESHPSDLKVTKFKITEPEDDCE